MFFLCFPPDVCPLAHFEIRSGVTGLTTGGGQFFLNSLINSFLIVYKTVDIPKKRGLFIECHNCRISHLIRAVATDRAGVQPRGQPKPAVTDFDLQPYSRT